MAVRKNGKKKKIGRWIVLAGVLIFLYFSFTGPGGIMSVYKARMKLVRERERKEKLERAVDSLKTELQKLKNDTAFIEKMAREKLGMAKEDEHIFKFPENQR